MKTIKQYSYVDAEVFKLENRRVAVHSFSENDYVIEFKTLSENVNPRALHRVEKNKIVITGIKISQDVAISLMIGLKERLIKDGLI